MNYVNRLLRTIESSDALDRAHDDALRSLARVGPAAADAILDAHGRARDAEARRDLDYVLANLGKKDERIYQVLLRQLTVDPDFGPAALAEYGDPRALPHLRAALQAFRLSETDPDRNHAVIELEAAIRALGGFLTTAERVKVARAASLRRGELGHA